MTLIPFTFVNTPELLSQTIKDWKNETEFGIDLEMENNLHHYGCYISLIQISSRTKNWIIDPLSIKDLSPVMKMFEDPDILKIFHDVTFDFRVLQDEYGCKPKNIFDSEKAAVFLGKESVGLGPLLEEYFGAKKECKFQMADWTKRPIKEAMLSYAIGDTTYLLRLKDKLEAELKKLNRMEWIKQTFKKLEEADYPLKQMQYFEFRGFKSLTFPQQALLKELFILREKLAKKVDRPIHFIINNRLLKDLLEHHPRTVDGWAKLKGVHPIVRHKAKDFFDAVNRAKKIKSLNIPKSQGRPKKFNEKQKRFVVILNEVREKLGNEYKMPSHIFLSKDEIKEIVVSNSFDCLLPWQRDVLKKEKSLKDKFEKNNLNFKEKSEKKNSSPKDKIIKDKIIKDTISKTGISKEDSK